jgi:ABC-2 type transport system ATP-binding protein
MVPARPPPSKIEGITAPSVDIFFRGVPVVHFRERAGIQFQQTALPDFLTTREALELFEIYENRLPITELVACSLEGYLTSTPANFRWSTPATLARH